MPDKKRYGRKNIKQSLSNLKNLFQVVRRMNKPEIFACGIQNSEP